MTNDARNPKEVRALLAIAVLGGALSVAAYPMTVATPQAVAMVFLVPVALVAVGRLRRQRGVQILAGVVLGLLVVGFVFGVGELVIVVMAGGPLVTIYYVGTFLLGLDRVGGAVWLLATTIALVAGFLTAPVSPQGSATLALLVAAAGSLGAVGRLRRAAERG